MANMRSPNYPAIGLSEAIDLARKLWDREKRSFTPAAVVVQSWGYSGLSGASRIKIAALRRYDLLEDGTEGTLRLSDLAIAVLHNPPGSADQLEALKSAGLGPDLFRELYQTHSHSSDESIRAYLITKRGFSDIGANSCIEAFRDTVRTAKLDSVEAEVNTVTAAADPAPAVAKRLVSSAYIDIAAPRMPQEDTMLYRWPLGRGVVAELKLMGEAKPSHLKLVKQYIDVAMLAMEMNDNEEGERED